MPVFVSARHPYQNRTHMEKFLRESLRGLILVLSFAISCIVAIQDISKEEVTMDKTETEHFIIVSQEGQLISYQQDGF